jgi:hypothetical protein
MEIVIYFFRKGYLLIKKYVGYVFVTITRCSVNLDGNGLQKANVGFGRLFNAIRKIVSVEGHWSSL